MGALKVVYFGKNKYGDEFLVRFLALYHPFFRPQRDAPNTNSRAFRLMMLRVGTCVMQGGMCEEVVTHWDPFLKDLKRCVAEKKLRELVMPSPVSASLFGKYCVSSWRDNNGHLLARFFGKTKTLLFNNLLFQFSACFLL